MIETFTESEIKTCKQPFAIKKGNTWYAFPKTVIEASLDDYKLWSEDSGRSMTGSSKGTLIGIFPKLQIKIGRQSANDRATLLTLLNQNSTTVRAYCAERRRFEEASFYFGDVVNKIKRWDAKGTLGPRTTNGNQPYTNKSVFDAISFSVISNSRRKSQ